MNYSEILLLLSATLAFYFFLSVIIIHIVRKDLSLEKSALSEYAIGNKGAYLTTGLILIGFSEIIIASISKDNFAASINLFLAGIGVTITGLIKMDKLGKKSLRNTIHNLGAILQFLFFPVAVYFFSSAISGSSARTYYIATSLVTSVLGILILILHQRYVKDKIHSYGLIQKVNILIINLWLIIIPLMQICR
ncbi:MAG: DUF998 domain-containing protein [Patescibacteria group bacterium]|jgi:hypothetical protein